MQAKKSLGQNFLTDTTILSKIIDSADIQPTDTVVEIGAGTGILTLELAKRASQVLAFEVDDDLIPGLLKQFPEETSAVHIVHEDILKADISKFLKSKTWIPGQARDDTSMDGQEKVSYRVIANIPYYITAPIIQHLLTTQPQPTDIILMVQKEVAERITAKPGQMSILAVSIQSQADTEYAFTVPKTAFNPVPKVESAIIRITPRANKNPLSKNFFRIVKTGFAAKRKTLANNLAAGLHLPKETIISHLESLGLNPNIRPQALSVGEWHQLETLFTA